MLLCVALVAVWSDLIWVQVTGRFCKRWVVIYINSSKLHTICYCKDSQSLVREPALVLWPTRNKATQASKVLGAQVRDPGSAWNMPPSVHRKTTLHGTRIWHPKVGDHRVNGFQVYYLLNVHACSHDDNKLR